MASDRKLGISITANFTKARQELEKFKSTVKNTSVSFKDGGLKSTRDQVKALDKETKVLGQSIFSAGAKFLAWTSIATVIAGVTASVKALGSEVVNLDRDLTTMSFTVGFTEQQFSDLTDMTEDFAKALGSTVDEARSASLIYSNLNSSLEDIISNSEASVVLSNLGGSALSIQDASNAIQSLQNQFGLANENALEIADTLTFISANLAMDFTQGIKEISNGISISGKLAKEAGLEYELFASILGKTVEATRRSGSSISSGIKTIISRLTRVQDLDADELSKIQGAYRDIGIEVLKDADTFKGFGEILGELNLVWDDLSDTQRKYISFLSAGTRQQSTFLAVVDNYSESAKLAEEATQNLGFATEQNEKFIESLAGRVNLLKATFQEFSRDFVSADFFKGFVDSGTVLIENLIAVENTVGILNSALLIAIPLIIALKGELIANKIITFSDAILTLSRNLKVMSTSGALATVGLSAFNLAMGGVALGVVGIIAGIAHLEKKEQELITTQTELTASMEEVSKQSGAIDKLVATLENTTEGTEEFYNITSQLNKLLPETADSIDVENQSLADQLAIYKELNEEKRKSAEDEAFQVIENEISSIEALTESIKDLEDQNRAIEVIRDIYVNSFEDITDITGLASEKLQQFNDPIRENESSIKDFKTRIEALTVAYSILNPEVESAVFNMDHYLEKMEDLIDTTEKEVEVNDEVVKTFQDTIDKVEALSEDYDLLSDRKQAEARNFIRGEIEKTNVLLREARARIEAYNIEAIAREQALFSGSGDFGLFQNQSNTEEFTNTLALIDQLTFESNKLGSELDSLINRPSTTSKTKDKITAQEQAVIDLTASLKLLETQEELALNIVNRNKLREQQIGVLEDLQEVVGEGTQEWLDYELAIRSVNEEIVNELNGALEDTNKLLEEETEILTSTLIKALEKKLDLAEKAKTAEQDSLDDSIEKLDNEIDALKLKNKLLKESEERSRILSDLSKAEDRLANIRGNRDTATIVNGKRVFTANPEEERKAQEAIKDLQEDLADHDRDVARDAQIRRKEDRIKEIEAEKRTAETIANKKIEVVENMLQGITDITNLELAEQSEAWKKWSLDNQEQLGTLASQARETVLALIALDARRLSNVASIASNQNVVDTGKSAVGLGNQTEQEVLDDELRQSIGEPPLPTNDNNNVRNTNTTTENAIDRSNKTTVKIDKIEVKDTNANKFIRDITNIGRKTRLGGPIMSID